jgi:hypothetical protein
MDSREEQISQIEAMAEKFEPRIEEAILQKIEDATSDADLDQLEESITSGDFGTILEHVFSIFDPAPVLEVMTAASWLGVMFTGRQLGTTLSSSDPEINRKLYEIEGQRRQGWFQNARDVTALVYRDSTRSGTTAFQAARDMISFLGLSPRDAQSILNYRRSLQDEKYSPREIKRLVDNMVKQRRATSARRVAITEATRSRNLGIDAALRAAVTSGNIFGGDIRRQWVHMSDSRVRDIHRAVPGDHPKGVALDEPFQTRLGPMMYPGDLSGSPENVINCRCTTILLEA